MIGWGMKKPFTNSLAVIFAVLGVYFVAFKVLMKVGVGVISWPAIDRTAYSAGYIPRWPILSGANKAMDTCFAPLIWLEKRIRGMEDWELDGPVPEPDWVKEYRGKP